MTNIVSSIGDKASYNTVLYEDIPFGIPYLPHEHLHERRDLRTSQVRHILPEYKHKKRTSKISRLNTGYIN